MAVASPWSTLLGLITVPLVVNTETGPTVRLAGA